MNAPEDEAQVDLRVTWQNIDALFPQVLCSRDICVDSVCVFARNGGCSSKSVKSLQCNVDSQLTKGRASVEVGKRLALCLALDVTATLNQVCSALCHKYLKTSNTHNAL